MEMEVCSQKELYSRNDDDKSDIFKADHSVVDKIKK